MLEYLATLRYYPGDSWGKIQERFLRSLARKYGVQISYEEIENPGWKEKENLWMENTLDKRVEDISQEVITVYGDRKEKFSACFRAIYERYRCPRTPYSLLGSNAAGQKMAQGLMNPHGGW